MKNLFNQIKQKKQSVLKKSSSDKSNFLDYSAKERLKILEKSAKESNKMQRELVDRYYKLTNNPS